MAKTKITAMSPAGMSQDIGEVNGAAPACVI